MKSMSTSLFLMLFALTALRAQLQIGLRTGINLGRNSDMELTEGVRMTELHGIYAAVILEKALTYRLSVQPELAFIQKGYQLDGFDSNLQLAGDSKTVYNYLAGGASLSYQITDGWLEWYVRGGGMINVALFGWNELTFYPNSGPTSANTRLKFGRNDLRRMDFELLAGTGLAIPVNNMYFMLDAVYGWGLIDLEETNDSLHPRHRSVRISLGAKFYLE